MSGDGKIRQMYQYHKIGCPIAWITGFLNRVSILRIKLDAKRCKNCGQCDKKCCIVAMESEKVILCKPTMETPGKNYACSKCLERVAICPNGSLKYKM
jgi:hypothetical protein